MKTKTIKTEFTITEGDVIECLTNDGWESGIIEQINEKTITVFIHLYNESRNFTFDLIKK